MFAANFARDWAIRLQTPEDLRGVIGAAGILPVLVPFARDRFEGLKS